MKRFLLVVIAIVGAGACNKPTADDCRLAISNMQTLLGTDTAAKSSDIESQVRLCKGGSTRESVACAKKATTPAELDACNFRKSKTAKPDSPKPDSPKPDSPKPDSPKPDSPKPDSPKPDSPKPDSPKPESPK